VVTKYDFYVLWDNTAYCGKFSDEGLPRYSNKIESKCPYYRYLTKKVLQR